MFIIEPLYCFIKACSQNNAEFYDTFWSSGFLLPNKYEENAMIYRFLFLFSMFPEKSTWLLEVGIMNTTILAKKAALPAEVAPSLFRLAVTYKNGRQRCTVSSQEWHRACRYCHRWFKFTVPLAPLKSAIFRMGAHWGGNTWWMGWKSGRLVWSFPHQLTCLNGPDW